MPINTSIQDYFVNVLWTMKVIVINYRILKLYSLAFNWSSRVFCGFDFIAVVINFNYQFLLLIELELRQLIVACMERLCTQISALFEQLNFDYNVVNISGLVFYFSLAYILFLLVVCQFCNLTLYVSYIHIRKPLLSTQFLL